MKGAPDFGQCFTVIRTLAQSRIELVDGFQHFFGFFYKDTENFIVQQFVIRCLGLEAP